MDEQLLIKQGEIYNGIDEVPWTGDILIKDGKIEKIEEIIEGRIVNDAKILDASGYRVYPGFVEAHGHLGLDGYGGGEAERDFNEQNDSITPHLSAVDGINPMDATFQMAREAGVTCVASGPGSSNVVGGTFCVLKTAGQRIDHMLVKKVAAMKCSFGENPKICYQDKVIGSRMTIAAKLREIIQKTMEYEKEHMNFDAKLEAMLPVIRREIPLKAHVHRADDIFTAIRIAKEFNLGLTLEHCTDGHLIADELAKEGYPIAVGPSLGHASKQEMVHKSFRTPAILANAGCQVSITTDSPIVEQQYLTFCAAMAMKEGMSEHQALQAITINPAKHIGAAERVGSIEKGKDGDLVIMKGSPFVVAPEIAYTIINGKIVYQKVT